MTTGPKRASKLFRLAAPGEAARYLALATPMWIVDVQRAAFWWGNYAGARLWGAEAPAQLLEKPFPKDPDLRAQLIDVAAQTALGAARVDDWPTPTAEGVKRLRLAATRIEVEGDRPALMFECAATHDCDRDEARLAEAARLSPLFIRAFDQSGALVAQNAAAAGFYGGFDAPGGPPRFAESAEAEAEAAALAAAAARSEPAALELRMKGADGARWRMVAARRGRDPATGAPMLIVSETDIEREREARRKLRFWNDEMARRLEEHARALEEASQEARIARSAAEQANRVKSTFLANMSHELRTPLNAILGFSELLGARGFGEDAPPEYTEYLGFIHTASQHLLSLVEQLLDLAKIESGALELSETMVEASEQLRQAVTMVRGASYAEGKSFTVSAPEDLCFTADPRALRQVLLNLLSNAAKFTRAGGEIRLSAAVADDRIELRIQDQGPGLPEAELEQVMEPYRQSGHAEHANEKGTGLGLPIARQLMRLHDGDLALSNAPEGGLIALLTLPAARMAPLVRAAG